jgi:hypothetical protein
MNKNHKYPNLFPSLNDNKQYSEPTTFRTTATKQIYNNEQRLLSATSNRADLQQYTSACDRERERKLDPAGNLSTHAHRPAIEKERKRDPAKNPRTKAGNLSTHTNPCTLADDRERERKRDLVPTHTDWRQRRREEERSGQKSTHTGRISLCQTQKSHYQFGLASNNANVNKKLRTKG